MARVLNIEIPDDKAIKYSLTYIYGIGLSTAEKILQEVNINPELRTKDLTDDQLTEIRKAAAKFTTEGDLRREVQYNIKRIMEIGSYKGIRHRKRLPVRGQSTKQNARTVKGPKKTVANKKKVTK